MKPRNFKAKTEEQIFSVTDNWHSENSLYDKDLIELHEALGWTWEEYSVWVETGKIPE